MLIGFDRGGGGGGVGMEWHGLWSQKWSSLGRAYREGEGEVPRMSFYKSKNQSAVRSSRLTTSRASLPLPLSRKKT